MWTGYDQDTLYTCMKLANNKNRKERSTGQRYSELILVTLWQPPTPREAPCWTRDQQPQPPSSRTPGRQPNCRPPPLSQWPPSISPCPSPLVTMPWHPTPAEVCHTPGRPPAPQVGHSYSLSATLLPSVPSPLLLSLFQPPTQGATALPEAAPSARSTGRLPAHPMPKPPTPSYRCVPTSNSGRDPLLD